MDDQRSPATILSLPVELLQSILVEVSTYYRPHHTLRLASVSQLFADLSLPLLYTKVQLDSLEQAEAFIRCPVKNLYGTTQSLALIFLTEQNTDSNIGLYSRLVTKILNCFGPASLKRISVTGNNLGGGGSSYSVNLGHAALSAVEHIAVHGDLGLWIEPKNVQTLKSLTFTGWSFFLSGVDRIKELSLANSETVVPHFQTLDLGGVYVDHSEEIMEELLMYQITELGPLIQVVRDLSLPCFDPCAEDYLLPIYEVLRKTTSIKHLTLRLNSLTTSKSFNVHLSRCLDSLSTRSTTLPSLTVCLEDNVDTSIFDVETASILRGHGITWDKSFNIVQ